MPPKASPNTQTSRPQATLASPASRDHDPRCAAISQTPIPIWIQTAEAPAWIGWYDQLLPAQFTTCWTQPGELAAVGSITCAGSPTAMAGWACSSPSRIHSTPKPVRSSWRQAGSGAAALAAAARMTAVSDDRSHSLTATQAAASTAKTRNTMIP
jgi:hypothetical protein